MSAPCISAVRSVTQHRTFDIGLPPIYRWGTPQIAFIPTTSVVSSLRPQGMSKKRDWGETVVLCPHECLLHNSPLSPGDNTASFVQNVTTLSGLEGYNLHHFEPFRGWVQAWGCRSTWLWGSYKITVVQGTRTGRNAVAEAVPAEPASGDGKVWQGSSRKPLGTQGFTPS